MIETIASYGIVPVVSIAGLEQIPVLRKAMAGSGLKIAEITYRTPFASQAIKELSEDFLIGAGTVHDEKTAREAMANGAKFIVTPGMNEEVIQFCLDHDLTVIPGCQTTRDLETACRYDLRLVKFFPAEQAGGLSYLKAVAAPYASLSFLPTGGINDENIQEYLKWDRVIACGGSWMMDFDDLENRFKKTIRLLLGLGLDHIGVPGEAKKEVSRLLYADSFMEISDQMHIGLRVRDLKRALFYFTENGYHFEREKNGEIWFQETIANMAVHLIERES